MFGKENGVRFIGDMQRLKPEPGDVFVITCEKVLSPEQCDHIRRECQKVFGADTKVLVMTGGFKFGVIGSPPTLNSTAPGA